MLLWIIHTKRKNAMLQRLVIPLHMLHKKGFSTRLTTNDVNGFRKL